MPTCLWGVVAVLARVGGAQCLPCGGCGWETWSFGEKASTPSWAAAWGTRQHLEVTSGICPRAGLWHQGATQTPSSWGGRAASAPPPPGEPEARQRAESGAFFHRLGSWPFHCSSKSDDFSGHFSRAPFLCSMLSPSQEAGPAAWAAGSFWAPPPAAWRLEHGSRPAEPRSAGGVR